jgi:hypothetical protein
MATHDNAIHRLIRVEREHARQIGAGEIEEDIGSDREGEQPGADGSRHSTASPLAIAPVGRGARPMV